MPRSLGVSGCSRAVSDVACSILLRFVSHMQRRLAAQNQERRKSKVGPGAPAHAWPRGLASKCPSGVGGRACPRVGVRRRGAGLGLRPLLLRGPAHTPLPLAPRVSTHRSRRAACGHVGTRVHTCRCDSALRDKLLLELFAF